MNDEDFDGSAMRELLAPAVADRGLTSAPTDAIVAAGRRRVVGRRAAVAGGALAIVAAVPLAASAIAAGPGTAGTTKAADRTGPGPAGTTKAPGAATPTRSGSPAQTKGGSPESATETTEAGDPAGLPAKPFVLAAGTVEGRNWSISAEATSGNNALTAGLRCLGLVLTVDGRASTAGSAPTIPYCLPVKNPANYVWAYQDTLQYDYKNGAGTLQMGMVPAAVTKIVAHVDGLAPVTATTVSAPGFAGKAFYFIPIAKDTGFRVSFDEYNAQGVKTGSFNNWTPDPSKQGR